MNDPLANLDKLNQKAYSKTDALIIQGWKERVPKLIAQADWLKHPVTGDLKREIEMRIRDIKEQLGEYDNLDPKQEATLRGEKKALQFIASSFPNDPMGELTTIDKAVQMEM